MARTPPMGWNTWNTFGCNIDEALIRQTADALVSSGMRDAGYRYVVVDDCWFSPNRDSAGNLQAAQVSFDGTRRVLAKRLANGDVAVALFNQGSATTTISTTAAAVGKTGSSFTLRDAWTNATSTTGGAISASVPGHGTVVYRVSGGPGGPTPPTATPTRDADGDAPTTTPPPTGACQVAYAVSGQWPGGFQGDVTIRNTGGTAVNGWTLRWSFANGQQLSQAWSASYTQSGAQVAATNVGYHASIPPGGSVNFGFIASWTGSNSSPTAFTLNGSACSTT